MRGLSYNLVLILVPLGFWAATRRRNILAWAVRSWRARRAVQAPVSPDGGLEPAPVPAPQASGTAGPAGKTRAGGPEGVAAEGAGKRGQPIVETRGNGVTGVWITVQRPGGDA
jgi:hypothetical protein